MRLEHAANRAALALRARGRARLPGALTRACEGSAVVDFAIIGPVFILMLVGIFEVAMLMLSQTMLQSAVTDAARAGLTGQGAAGLTREELIRRTVEQVGGNIIVAANLRLETLVYPSFENVGKPEPYTDVNSNGSFDAGEPFTDVNGNGAWDRDMGREGLGGPSDIVLYRVLYDWQPMTPLLRGVLPNAGRATLTASFAVRNEPFPAS